MTITVTKVGGRSELREFCELPLRLHPRDRYVPTLEPQIRTWYRDRTVELHVARDAAGRPVGRICLHRYPGFDRRIGKRAQLFGLTEFADPQDVGEDVAEELFDLTERAGAGTEVAFGPVSLLPNQSGGVITSGFGDRGFIDSAWNPAYYPAAYEQHGFTRRFGADTWVCENLDGPGAVDPGQAFLFDDSRIAAEGLRIHHGSRRKLAEQLPLLRGMLNASFAQLGYYTEISAAELAAQTDGLAHLLDEQLLLYLTAEGEPVAFVLAVPDISEFVMAARGRLGLPQQLRLLATRGRYRSEAVLIIKGTVPGHQGKGYLTLLARELHRNLRSGGYRTLRSTFVEHGNAASAAQYRRVGGRPLHGYTFYERAMR